MPELAYIGSELDVFAHAANWKRYVLSHMRPYISGSVLEVGAGIGSNTMLYFDGSQDEWVCLEPDPSLAERIPSTGKFKECEVFVGTVKDLPASRTFDSIIYLDVLEHIEDDRAEMELAADRLNPGGYLAVLSPAHQWLYTPFDEAIGHYRRYNRSRILSAAPPSLSLEKLIYLDSAGLSASFANRIFLRSPTPTVSQIKIWDRLLVPISRTVDAAFCYRLGKSILGVWRKPQPCHRSA
jgi:SAM-dependent methyltransferase